MITDGLTQRFFGPERFADGNLKVGETFSVDSGLGGSFVVAYGGHFGGKLLFEREAGGAHPYPIYCASSGVMLGTHDGWPAASYWYDNDEDAARHVFILVPMS